MSIKIQGTVNVNAPREEVWDLLFTLAVIKSLAARVPGVLVERLDQIDELHYEGTAVLGVAAIKGKYDGKITVLEKRQPEYVRIKGEGKGGGNWTSGEIELTLTGQDGATVMTYRGLAHLSGPLASLGQRLVDTVGREMIDHGARIFADEIETRRLLKLGAPMPAPPTAPARAIPAWALALLAAALVVAALVVYYLLTRG